LRSGTGPGLLIGTPSAFNLLKIALNPGEEKVCGVQADRH